MKPRVISTGFHSEYFGKWFRCPVCIKTFESYSVSRNKKNENGTKEYCPYCKTELDGLDLDWSDMKWLGIFK